jgi:CheY-like chemotaxis protein
MSGNQLVLIIEDNSDFQHLYGIVAEGAGFTVEQVYDGREALARLDRDPIPDIVFLDAFLPHVGGEDVLAAARKNPKWAKVPIYILTADVREAQRLRGIKPEALLANGVIEKGGDSIAVLRVLLADLRKEA